MPSPIGHPPYNKNGEGGAPLFWTEEKINDLADKFILWWNNEENVWFEDFALSMKILPKYLSMWAAKNDRFREAMEYADAMQKSRLINGGLKKMYHYPACSLILSNKHGFKAQNEIVVTNSETIDDYIKQGDGKSKDLVITERNDK